MSEGGRECLTDFEMNFSADIKLTSVSSNAVQLLITVVSPERVYPF